VFAKTMSRSPPADLPEALQKPSEPDPNEIELYIVHFCT